jgi:hypothetical protein
MNRPLGFFLTLVLATLVGCGAGAPKYASVKGTVTYNGKPIEKGQITFALPGLPPSTMDIDDGKFNGQAMVGENKVAVSMMKRVANPPKQPKEAEIMRKGYAERAKASGGREDGGSGEYDPSIVEVIPPEWGMQGKQTRVVEAGSTNEFEFNIKGKN